MCIRRNYILLFLFASTLCTSLQGKSTQITASEILKQLYRSIGNFQQPMPYLEIVDSEELVAAYIPNKNVIYLEEKAFEVCRTFEKDSLSALAFLIGHELTHCYQKVGWASNFLAYDKVANGAESEEKAADVQGALAANIAGYNTLKIISPLIERLYESYHLSDKLSGYPSKLERQETADEVTGLVSELLAVYQTGNYLSALGHYEMAAHSYEYILDYYLGNEIYNNLGFLYASHAMVFSGKQVDKYVYPFELDTETRLATPRADDLSQKETEQRKELLKKALSYFDQALTFDQRNTQAYINRMCVLIQQGDYKTVTNLFQSGHMGKTLNAKKASNKEQGDARLMAAIAFAMSSEANPKHISSAKNLFRELTRHSDPQVKELAVLNESIFLETYSNKTASPSCLLSKGTRRIDGVSVLSHISVKGKWLDDSKQAELYWEKLPQSTVSVSRWMGNPLVIQRITKKSIPAPGDVRVGYRAEVLIQQSESQDYKLIPTGTGYYIHFPECRVIFAVNEKGYIAEWARYFD